MELYSGRISLEYPEYNIAAAVVTCSRLVYSREYNYGAPISQYFIGISPFRAGYLLEFCRDLQIVGRALPSRAARPDHHGRDAATVLAVASDRPQRRRTHRLRPRLGRSRHDRRHATTA